MGRRKITCSTGKGVFPSARRIIRGRVADKPREGKGKHLLSLNRARWIVVGGGHHPPCDDGRVSSNWCSSRYGCYDTC